MSFNGRYWVIVGPLWLLSCLVVAAYAAVGSPTWQDAAAWACGWWVFAVALWWTLDTVRTYRRGERALDPETVLDRRLANGEISVEEYQRRRAALVRSESSGGSS